MFEAYLDDYNVITVIIKDSIYKNEMFLLLDHDRFYQLTLSNKLVKNGYYHLSYSSSHDIILGKKYYVYNDDGISSLLISRKIVDTSRFEVENYSDKMLGSRYSKSHTEFSIWAPLAFTVLVIIYVDEVDKKTCELRRGLNGVFNTSVKGDLDGCKYYYLIENNHKFEKCCDPYADGSAINNRGSSIVNISSSVSDYQNVDILDSVIYEASIRDVSSLIQSKMDVDGYYNQFTKSGLVNKYGDVIGYDYIKDLGVTHVQLMPVQYCGSIDESSFFRRYNWGYDVMQHNVLEGYYASNPLDPYNRIKEFKMLVDQLHEDQIGVILDVVYNHVYDVEASCFNKAVPGYYFRYNNDGYLYNGSGCGNDFASEKRMVQRYIVDSVYRLALNYNIDGFRFDLMGLIDIDTMKMIKDKLSSLGRVIYLYGEGWQMQTKIDQDDLAVSINSDRLKGVGFFGEVLRDRVKGSTFNVMDCGIAQGNYEYYSYVKEVLEGSSEVSLDQTINYLSCHDNHTLYDRYLFSSFDDVKRSVMVSYTFLLLSRGVPFMHMGCEFLRSKNGTSDSYVSDDMVNGINWDLVSLNNDVVNHVRCLIKIRKKYDFFRSRIHQNLDVLVRDDVVYVDYGEVKLYINLKKYNAYVNVKNCVGIYVNGVMDFDGFGVLDTVVISPGSFFLMKNK